MMFQIPVWSNSANQSIGLLYRELQDIEIYVEDQDSEALYTKLLSRAVNNQVKIKKVIPLNGRANVVNCCKSYKGSYPALFIIDGDLGLLCGQREQPHSRLFQHKMYCMENYLFCKSASAELLQNRSGRLLESEALELLEWDKFTSEVQGALLELFKIYAVSWKLSPEIPTVSRSYHKMCRQISRTRGSAPCAEKITKVIDEIKYSVLASCNEEEFQKVYSDVSEAIDKLDNPLYAISGKDYLLKALRDHLDYKGASYAYDDGFKFQLAKYCNTAPLNELGEAIIKTAKGDIFRQAS